MRKSVLFILGLLTFGACAANDAARMKARPVDAVARVAGEFDLERYLNIRGHVFEGFSHDGKYAFYLSGVTGTMQLWRVSTDGGWPEQITYFSDRVQFASPSPTDDWVIVGRDIGGNENSQLFLVKNDGSVIKDLTKAPTVKHDFGGWSRDGRKIAYSSNARTQKSVLEWRAAKQEGKAAGDEPPTSTDVYVMEIGGDAKRVHEAPAGELFNPSGFSPDGKMLLLSRANGSVDNDLYILNFSVNTIKHITPHKGAVSYSADFSFDGKSLWMIHNDNREYPGLFRYDLANGKITTVRSPDAEVESVAASRDGKWLAVGTIKDGGRDVELIDTNSYKGKILPLGVGIPGGVDFMDGTSKIAYSMNGPRDPSDVYIYDYNSGESRRLTNAFLAGIPRETFVEPEAVHYASFDGMQIEALLWRPAGKGPHPTIVEFHGGPEGQHRPQFSSLTQYYISRGYAVFQPNVRGSTGYGRKFGHADDIRNREKSVRDGAAGVEWLISNGIADRKRVAAYGGSYGGYMVLASLTLFPDLWAAGVDIVGIANFVSFLENTSGYRRRLRESEYGAAGSEKQPGADREFLTNISPIHRVAEIKCPLLVIHGEQDPRVPVGEARQIEAALKKLDRPVQAFYYPDEGHGIAKLKNRLDCYPKMIEFLDKVLRRPQS
ncbi:MAG: S9 family peptidase [Planctomycetes bacterium]|nr:S9 family peptidase [Planctomycetota bacterium]